MNAVVITGLGLVSAYGTSPAHGGVERFWNGLRANTLPVSEAHDGTARIDPGAVHGIAPERWFEVAIAEALTQAQWRSNDEQPRLIVAAQAQPPHDSSRWNPLFAPSARAVSANAPIVVSNACASALFGIEAARRLIASGAARAVIVAGVSAANPYTLETLRAVKAVGASLARPFDVSRDGIVIGEGAGAILLESAEYAAARGARALAKVAAVTASVGGRHSAASDDDAIVACMLRAHALAGAPAIGYIHAHATGTVQGDAAELDAISRFVKHNEQESVAVSSHKGALGHLLHASAFPSVVAAVSVLQSGEVPPTPGLSEARSTDGVALTPPDRSRAAPPIRAALVNAFGFGGSNASVVLTHS